MENTQKKINIIDEDRLSNLPGDVIERIMDSLTVPEAARTCVLSTKWRCVWANHPSLKLYDMCFWYDRELGKTLHKFDDNHDIVCANIVSSMLLSHLGHIRKFDMDLMYLSLCHKQIDSWLSYLCRKSLKVLHFADAGDRDYKSQYQLPSCVFEKSELTHLSLSFCFIKKAIGCFNSIRSLILECVHINSVILTTPLLNSLSMKECFNHDDTDFVFDIFAPKLASLTLEDNCVIPNLHIFLRSKDIDYAFLSTVHNNVLQCDGKHLVDLLGSWPKVSVLVMDGLYFEELTRASIPRKVDIPPLNLRRFALRGVDLDCKKIAWCLHVLKNTPLLHTFEIQFGKKVVNENDEPSVMDFKMDRLRIIKIKGFSASRNEVILINILLKCARFLEKMFVEEGDDYDDEQLDPWKQNKILKELFLLQSKYRNAKIIFTPRDS